MQPEAPPEIIKASYRSLMSKLKLHPDLGGDHEIASLINQAYAVLSDPERRRQYDKTLNLTHGGKPFFNPGQASNSTQEKRTQNSQNSGQAPINPQHPANPGQATSRARRTESVGVSPPTSSGNSANSGQPSFQSFRPDECPFCRTGFALKAQPTHCAVCRSPLVRIERLTGSHELFGRRAAPRISKSGTAIIYPVWPHPGVAAELRDLSPTGIRLACKTAIGRLQTVRIQAELVHGIAQVVTARTGQGLTLIHAHFLTAEFARQAGGFLSTRV